MLHGCSIEEVSEALPLFRKASLAKSRSWNVRFKRMAISKFKSLDSAKYYAAGEIRATTKSDFSAAWFFEDVRKQISIMENNMAKCKGKKPPKR